MSKGTPLVVIRVPEDLKAEVEAVVEHRNWNSKEEPWSFSDFVRIALREKIAKMARCRKGPVVFKKTGRTPVSNSVRPRRSCESSNVHDAGDVVQVSRSETPEHLQPACELF